VRRRTHTRNGFFPIGEISPPFSFLGGLLLLAPKNVEYSIFSPKKRWVRKKRKKSFVNVRLSFLRWRFLLFLIKEEKKLSIFCVGERKEKNIPAKRDKLQSVWNLKKK
jgi:hypothetical protein